MQVHEARVQAPQWEQFSDTPLFNTKAVVRQTGIPAPTLRAWERRYDILTPRRGANDYRLYSERDMAMISWLRERVGSGLTISQAIALLRSLEPSRRRGRRTRPVSVAALEAPEAEPATQAEPAASQGITLADLSDDLLRHLAGLNEAGALQVMTQAFAIYSVEDVCISLFTPTLVRLGLLWRAGRVSVTAEHFATSVIRGQLESLYRSAPQTLNAPLALVGSAPGELHDVGAFMLALFLRRAGLRVVYLGQNVESTSLLAAVERFRPTVLALSAATSSQAESLIELGRRLEAFGPRPPLYIVGGQAFTGEPALVRRTRGAYLGLDAHAAALEIRRRLTA